MRKPLENAFEAVIFSSRWVQAPLYFGLIVASVLYAYKFAVELLHICQRIQTIKEEELMLGVLGLVDVTMVANLLMMVVIGGYATFVSKMDLDEHEDRPDWLDKVDAATLKIKLSASLVGISGIHLLKAFINIEERNLEHVKWQVIIHVVFLLSSLLLAASERILHGPKDHH